MYFLQLCLHCLFCIVSNVNYNLGKILASRTDFSDFVISIISYYYVFLLIKYHTYWILKLGRIWIPICISSVSIPSQCAHNSCPILAISFITNTYSPCAVIFRILWLWWSATYTFIFESTVILDSELNFAADPIPFSYPFILPAIVFADPVDMQIRIWWNSVDYKMHIFHFSF